MSTVLITTANLPPSGVPHLALVASGPRVVSARAAALLWAVSGIKQIVIVDCTGSVLFSNDDLAWITSTGVRVEQLSFQQNTELVQQRGKGHGEAKILEYALASSELLRVESSFYKCTGKVFCRNFSSIEKFIVENGVGNCFWKHYDDRVGFDTEYIDTRFFYTSREFAQNLLVPKLLEANDWVKSIETCCYELIKPQREAGLGPRPRLMGLAGGSGKWYNEHDLGYIDTNYPSWRW